MNRFRWDDIGLAVLVIMVVLCLAVLVRLLADRPDVTAPILPRGGSTLETVVVVAR